MGSVVGTYQIIRKLGEGGMGAVYLAQHTLLGRRAALKMLQPQLSARPDVVQRFFNEARATTSISDPGIVQIFDFGYHGDGSAYIVMEYLEGEGLDARLAKLGRMPVLDALRLTRQVASSLAAAHAQQIVHRDLKPENIFLVRDAEVASGERPKILDFGIAKLSDDHPGKMKTQTGALMGTPTYMSPEQCRGASELDHRSDIYALGCVMFHLVTGAPPFDGDGIGEIIASHLRTPAPALGSRVPGVSPEVEAIVAHCLAKRPEDRFQTMLELAAAIGRVLPHSTYPGPSAPTQLVRVGGGGLTPPPSSMNPSGFSPNGSSLPDRGAVASGSAASGPEGAWQTKNAPVTGAPPHHSMPLTTSNPTTLGSGTGEVTPTARQARWVLPLLAVLVLGGGVLGAVLVLPGGGGRGGGGGGDSSAATVVVEPPPPPATAPVAVAPPVDAAVPDAPIDAAPDAAPVAIDAGVPVAKPPRPRPRPPRPTTTTPLPAPGSDACDRRIDVDCDGIPDVR